MGGVATQRLCYQAPGPCGPLGAPGRRVPGIGRPLRAGRSKTDPTCGPGEERAASCPSVVSLSSMLRSLPLGHRVEGRSSPSGAFPKPPPGRITASRRQRFASPDFSTAPRRQPRLLNSATATPRLLSQSKDRSPSPGDSLHSLPGGSLKSPPSAGPRDDRALAPSAGPPGGSTLGTAKNRAEGREHGAQPSARNPKPSTAGHSFPEQGSAR